jgi:hypothetical protein
MTTEIIESINSKEKVAIIWSDSHTLGHIAIKADNPLIKHLQTATTGKIQLPCDLVEAGKFRNGNPRKWCRTHQMHYGKKSDNGNCSSAHIELNYCSAPFELDPSEYAGGIALWCALPPAIDTTSNKTSSKELGIHVHCRPTLGNEKSIDKTFPAIRVKIQDPLGISFDWIDVTPSAALAWLKAKKAELPMTCTSCSYCNTPHLDLGDFSINPHRKHLCGNCGKDFWVKKPLISNPLTLLSQALDSPNRMPELASESLEINSADYPGGLEIWSWTPAIVWSSLLSEHTGIHIHAYDVSGKRVIDETYGSVILNGTLLNADLLLSQMLEQVTPSNRECNTTSVMM